MSTEVFFCFSFDFFLIALFVDLFPVYILALAYLWFFVCFTLQ